MFGKSALFGLLSVFAAALTVTAAPADHSLVASRTKDAVIPDWPMFVTPGKGAQSADGMRFAKKDTNAARIQRGLSPIVPARLYNNERRALKPRVSNPLPPSGTGSYTLQGCGQATSERGRTTRNNLPISFDDFLAQCAKANTGLQPGDSGGVSNTFSIAVIGMLDDGSPQYLCSLAVYSFVIEACTEINPAFYTRP